MPSLPSPNRISAFEPLMEPLIQTVPPPTVTMDAVLTTLTLPIRIRWYVRSTPVTVVVAVATVSRSRMSVVSVASSPKRTPAVL